MPQTEGGGGGDTTVPEVEAQTPEQVVARLGGPTWDPVPVPKTLGLLKNSLRDRFYAQNNVDLGFNLHGGPQFEEGTLPGQNRFANMDIALDSPWVADFINERMHNLDPRVVELAPALTWKIIMSGAGNSHVARTVNALNATVPWLLEKDTFGGEEALLTPARLYALYTNNALGVKFLDSLSELSLLEQRVLLRQLRRPTLELVGFDFGDVTSLESVGTFARSAPAIAPEFSSDVMGWSIEEIQALQSASTWLRERWGIQVVTGDQGMLQFNFAPDVGVDPGMKDAFVKLFPDNPLLPGASFIDMRNTWESMLELSLPELIVATGAEATEMTFMVGGMLMQGAQTGFRAAASGLTRLVGGLTPMTDREVNQAALRAAGFAGAPIGAAMDAFAVVDTVIRKGIRNSILQWVDLDPKMEEDIETILSGLAQIFIFNRVGAMSRGFKAGRRMLPDAARGSQGVAEGFLETQFGRPGRTQGPLFHPLRATNDLATRLGIEMAGVKSLDDAVELPFVQRTFDDIARIVEAEESLGAAAVRIREITGGTMGMNLIERLVKVERGMYEHVFIDHIRERSIIKGERVRLREESATAASRLQQIEDSRFSRNEVIEEFEYRADQAENAALGMEYQVNRHPGRPVDFETGSFEIVGNFGEYIWVVERAGTTGQWFVDYIKVPLEAQRMGLSHELYRQAALEVNRRGGEGLYSGTSLTPKARRGWEARERAGDAVRNPESEPTQIEGITTEPAHEFKYTGDLYPTEEFIDQATRVGETYREKARQARENAALVDFEAMDLRLMQEYRKRRINELSGDLTGTPPYFLPRSTRMVRFTRGATRGGISSAMADSFFVRPLRKLLRKTVNEINRMPTIYAPWGKTTDRPLDWKEVNVDVMSNWLERAKVPEGVRRQLVGDLVQTQTRGEFFDWTRKARDAVLNSLPPYTPAHVLSKLEAWFEHPDTYKGNTTVRTSPGVREPIVPRSNPLDPDAPLESLPGSPTEFKGNLVLPDVALLMDATSNLRRAMRFLGRHRKRTLAFGGVGGVLELAYHVPKAVFSLGTTTFKAPILALRVFAMTERIQLEQALRAHFYGGLRGALWFPHGVLVSEGFMTAFGEAIGFVDRATGGTGAPTLGTASHYLIQPDSRFTRFNHPRDMNLGNIHQQLMDDSVDAVWGMEDMSRINATRRHAAGYHYTAYATLLQNLRRDWFNRKFIELDLNVDAMLAYIEAHPRFKNYVEGDQLDVLLESELATRPSTAAGIESRKTVAEEALAQDDFARKLLERMGETVPPVSTAAVTGQALIRMWLERKGASYREILDADPAAQAAIVSGTYQRGTQTTFDGSTISGERMSEVYARRVDELTAINARIRQLQQDSHLGRLDDAGQATLVALHREAKILRAHVDRLRRERGRPVTDEAKPGRVPLENTRKVANEVQRLFDNGQFSFPREMPTKRRYAGHEAIGLRENLGMYKDGWNRFWYSWFKPASWADVNVTRGSVYYQIAHNYYPVLRKRGYTEAEATAWAQLKAAADTRDLMYDLAARTSLQTAVKDLYWFAPAAQEILYTWLFKIPLQYAGGLGYFLIPAKVNAFLQTLRGMNIITEVRDKQGDLQEVIQVPGLAAFLERMLPGNEKWGELDTNFKLEGFNMVLQPGFGFSLATLPAGLLGKASREWGGVFKELSDLLNHFGEDVQATPRQLVFFWNAITGSQWPIEFMSPDLTKAQYDRSMDIAIQYAIGDKLEAGEGQPRVEDFATRELYYDARDTWMEEVMDVAKNDYFEGIALLSMLGSSVTPAQLYVTKAEQEEWRTYWNEVIDPAGDEEKTNVYNQRQKNLIDDFIADHPYSLAYTIGYTVYGESQKELPYESTGDEKFFDEFYTGERRVLPPEDYLKKVMVVESFRFYNSQRQKALEEIGNTAPSMLINGYKRLDAMVEFTEAWGAYQAANSDAVAILEESRRSWEQRYGIPQGTYEAELIADTLEGLKVLSPLFTGETGLRTKEYLAVKADLTAAWVDTRLDYQPTSKVGQGMQWYFNEILGPYLDQTQKLYFKAQELTSAGLDASDVYDQIRAINNEMAANPPKHGGKLYPTVEEVFFGNKSPAEQQSAVYNWTTKPPTWLSDFQLEKVGIAPEFKGRDKLLSRLAQFDDDWYAFVDKRNVSPSSTYYEQLQQWGEQQRRAIAADYGVNGQAILALYNATPAERLWESGFGTNNQFMQDTFQAATHITRILEGMDLSPKGDSGTAIYYKSWLYGVISSLRARNDGDNAYNELWENLAWSVPELGREQREGALLYEAILFNEWNREFIHEDIITAAGGGF